MWSSILSFDQSSLLHAVAKTYEAERKPIPFRQSQMYRLQFILPWASLALWLDTVELENADPRLNANLLDQTLAALAVAGKHRAWISNMLIWSKEAAEAKTKLKPGFLTRFTEEQICRAVMDSRLKDFRDALRRLHQGIAPSDPASGLLKGRRITDLAQVAIAMATADPAAIEDDAKGEFVGEILTMVYAFYDDQEIPALKLEGNR